MGRSRLKRGPAVGRRFDSLTPVAMATMMDHQPQIYPATNKAPLSSGSANNRDVHFIEPKSTSSPSSSSSTRGALQELSARHIHNQGVAQNSPQQHQNQKLHLRPSAVKVPSSFRRARRSSTEPEAFELLEVVEEEDSNLSAASSPANSNRSVHQQSSEGYICKSHPLAEAWPSLNPHLDHRPATPLTPEEYMALGFEPPQTSFSTPNMALPPPPAYDDHQTLPLKVPEVVEVVEQAVSPSLTLISDRCSSYGGSSRNGSFSVPRIEDSFEELDKLEDELEAIDAFTQSRRIALPENVPSSKHLEPPSPAKMPTISKRASAIGMSSTVRVKPTEKSQVPLRRSTSLVFRDKKQNDADDTLKPKPQLTRGNNSQSTPSKAPVKSTKAPTIPKFELPGEAVARRLKEQREARRAQQAEAQRAYVPPPRPKSSKPLTKPIFELPGEAISRRKREEREARLKAQEEEGKRKREFKARPMRNSFTPASIPRETIASLARQGRLPQEDTEKQPNAAKTKRASILGPRPSPSSEGQISQNRGRLSTATSQEHLSRGTSVSKGSGSGKRALTAEEAHQLKVRGKEIFQRDNNGYMRDKEREKREREEATRLAREQAAERSRIASREWAEKKRLKEQALLQAIRGQ
ncbi:hypothetical protein LB507_003619 [Fusarium sp. FIESC RH6]|nr:hypothetical protein LB507_003619 [Fusarium sp. FIESC RH6]